MRDGETAFAGSFCGWIAEAGASRRDDRLECRARDSTQRVHSGNHKCPQDGERETAALPQAGGRTLVEGGSHQAHRSGHVPENLILGEEKLDGRALIDAIVVYKPLAIRLR